MDLSKLPIYLIASKFSRINFTGPFVAPVNQALRLTNRSDKRVGFKVKTTAPTRYCVRPNAGLLDPSESASVTSMQIFPTINTLI